MSKKILLTQNQYAVVDDSDFEWLNQWEWCALWYSNAKSFYAVRNVRKTDGKYTLLSMHQAIMGKPNRKQIDHINHDTLDNRKTNLRICTTQQNNMNQKLNKNNTSGFKGVFWSKGAKKWQAQIMKNGKFVHLGLFNNIKIAAQSYDNAARELFGEFARLNF